jgi:DTW domain-containing protein YfiP
MSKLPEDCPYHKLYDDRLNCPKYQKCVVNPKVHERLVEHALKIMKRRKMKHEVLVDGEFCKRKSLHTIYPSNRYSDACPALRETREKREGE